MNIRLFVLLLVPFMFAGCNRQQSDAPSHDPAVPTLGVPMPTPEILAALGPENDIPIQYLLPNPIFVTVGKPKQFLDSPLCAGGEELVADTIVEGLRLYKFDAHKIERFIQSSGVPIWVPIQQDPYGQSPPTMVPQACRSTVITFDEPVDLTFMLGFDDDPAFLESVKHTEGKNEFYDLTPPNYDGLLRIAVGLVDECTAVFVEGTSEDVKSVFSDTIPKNAVLERLKRTPLAANEFTILTSLEGLSVSPEDLEQLLVQAGVLWNVSPAVQTLVHKHLRALTFSINVSAAEGQPVVSIYAEGRDEKSAAAIKETIQGMRIDVQATLAAMSEEAKAALPISANFAFSLLNAMSVEVNETRVTVTLNNFETLIPTVAGWISDGQIAKQQIKLLERRVEQLQWHWNLYDMYYEEHQKFPSDITDAEGNPLLSWRVALLPSMGSAGVELYSKFKTDEPWDSETNAALLNPPNSIPRIFDSLTEDIDPSKTVIRFFNSAGTPFSKKDLKREDLPSPANTLMFIVVSPRYAVEWTKPESLEFDGGKISEILESPQSWAVSFTGNIGQIPVLPDTAPQYEEWRRQVESLIKVLPLPEQQEPPP